MKKIILIAYIASLSMSALAYASDGNIVYENITFGPVNSPMPSSIKKIAYTAQTQPGAKQLFSFLILNTPPTDLLFLPGVIPDNVINVLSGESDLPGIRLSESDTSGSLTNGFPVQLVFNKADGTETLIKTPSVNNTSNASNGNMEVSNSLIYGNSTSLLPVNSNIRYTINTATTPSTYFNVITTTGSHKSYYYGFSAKSAQSVFAHISSSSSPQTSIRISEGRNGLNGNFYPVVLTSGVNGLIISAS
ncbi:MAG: hypothetical protein ACJA0H_002233 [Francisellaceae bacterium]|jgi:hypothetical protein